ncbi:pyridoxamine 5'-phosphate oxidase family protein [Methanocrinis sp.]|uniref:pyridoxamine 5'-phosphate oxidase family protein n=1 Tax=Methanocrinis sp. TaxID=3101522 RepID=UPI003D0E8906
MAPEVVKIPSMKKREYDRLINEEHVCRIAFKGDKYPYVAPFVYIFDGRFMYFLSTKYGKKIELFREDPHVSVEVERYAPDLSSYSFVTLRGRLVEASDPGEKRAVRERFVDLIRRKNLSRNVLSALGHSPSDPLDSIVEEERSLVWKLVDVEKIMGLKDGDKI